MIELNVEDNVVNAPVLGTVLPIGVLFKLPSASDDVDKLVNEPVVAVTLVAEMFVAGLGFVTETIKPS